MDSRYRGGESNPKAYATFASDVITPGDNMWWDDTNKCVRPASYFTWNTDLATTQTGFHDVYAGVSGAAKLAGSTKSVVCNRTGRHEFDCASATFSPGALVGPAKQAGNALENQKVVSVATAALAIGRVERYTGGAVTKVNVEVLSSLTAVGGVQPLQ